MIYAGPEYSTYTTYHAQVDRDCYLVTLTYDFFDNSKLVSTSYDGTVRVFDINEKKSSMIYAGLGKKTYTYTTYHAQVDRDCYLVTLGGSGAIGLIDRRASGSSFKMKI